MAQTIDITIDEELYGITAKALNSFYKGDLKYIIFGGGSKEDYQRFESALFKLIDKGNGIANPRDKREKKIIADLVRNYPVEDLFAIFDMGKLAKAGNEEAQLDLLKWYSGAIHPSKLMARGCKQQAEEAIQKYRTKY